MGKNFLLTGAAFFIGISILISGYLISNSLNTLELAPKQEAISVNNSDKTSDDLLTIPEAAVYLKVDNAKIEWLVSNSKFIDGNGIPYFKINGVIWFSKNALSNWVEKSANNHYEW